MTPGIYEISFDEYAQIDAISNTALGKVAESPARYHFWRQTGKEKASDAMRIGRVAHRAILEPKEFEAEFANAFAVKPETYKDPKTGEDKKWNGRAKVCREWVKAEEAEGRQVIDKDEEEFYCGAPKAIAAHPLASAMLANGFPEQSIVAEFGGVRVKARLDFRTKGDTIVDVKTCESADPKDFYWRAIIGRKIYRQAAFYIDACNAVGLPMRFFTILAIEKAQPYLISCHQITDELVQRGREEYMRLLNQLVECKRTNTYPGYEAKLHPAPLPENYNRVPDPAWLTEPLAA